jgi:hypothetical protein
LGLGDWTSKRGRVLGVEPDAAVAVEQPVAEAPGIAQLRLEGPAVDSPIDQFGAAVLPGGSDDSQTHAEESLLFPTGELLHGHGWSAQQVDGEAEGSVEQTRAVGRSKKVLLSLPLLTLMILVSGCEELRKDTSSLLIPSFQRSEIFGFIAGLGTTFAVLPDLLAMLRRRSSAGMNPRMAAIYGLFKSSGSTTVC